MRAYWRAWSEYNEKMGSVIVIDFEEGEVLIELELDDGSKARHFDDLDNIHLMQNTGIKDKKGVEIYEGDIVKWSRLCMDFNLENYEERSDNFVVEWDVYNTGFVLGDGEVFLYKDISTELEVIGSIYDNRDLIQGDAIDGRNE